MLDGRLLDTDFIPSILPGWLGLALLAAAAASVLYGLYQLLFVERNKVAFGGVAAAVVIGAVVFFNQSDTGPSLTLMQSEEERDFRGACKRAGNNDDACNCTWDAFEREFSSVHLKILVASLAKDQALVRRLMSAPGFDNAAYFGSVLQRTPAIERRCRVAF